VRIGTWPNRAGWEWNRWRRKDHLSKGQYSCLSGAHSLQTLEGNSARTSAMDFTAIIATPRIKTIALSTSLILIAVWMNV